MMMNKACTWIGFTIVVVLVLLASGSKAKAPSPAEAAQEAIDNAQDTIETSMCVARLLPCVNYLQSSSTRNPPRDCCDPLKTVIKSNPQCLCKMITSKASSAAGQAGIDLSKAQQLPGQCGEYVNPIGCLLEGGSATTSDKDTIPYGAASKRGMFSNLLNMTILSLAIAVVLLKH